MNLNLYAEWKMPQEDRDWLAGYISDQFVNVRKSINDALEEFDMPTLPADVWDTAQGTLSVRLYVNPLWRDGAFRAGWHVHGPGLGFGPGDYGMIETAWKAYEESGVHHIIEHEMGHLFSRRAGFVNNHHLFGHSGNDDPLVQALLKKVARCYQTDRGKPPDVRIRNVADLSKDLWLP